MPPRPPHPPDSGVQRQHQFPESEDEDGLFSMEPESNRPIHMAAHGLYQEVKQVAKPTKIFVRSLPAHVWHLFCNPFLQWYRKCYFLVLFGQIYIIFVANLASYFSKIVAGTAPFNGNLWEKFSGQHQSIKNNILLEHFWCK